MDKQFFELNETKWFLLKELEKGALSPKELANLTDTSIANASQQLKLLEAQGFIKKIKKKGVQIRKDRDARILYSISKPKVWISKISSDFVDKKELNNNDDFLINLMLCDLKDIRHVIKFFINNEELFKKIQCLFYLQTLNNEIHFLVITDELNYFRKDNHSFEVNYSNKKVLIKFWSHSIEEFKQGINNDEVYYVDLVKRIYTIYCDNDVIKSFFREWKK